MALTIHPDLPINVVRAGRSTAREGATSVDEPAAIHHVRDRPDFEEMLAQADIAEPEAEAATAADAIGLDPNGAVAAHADLDPHIVDLLIR